MYLKETLICFVKHGQFDVAYGYLSIAYGKFMPPKLKYDHTVRFCARLVFFSLVCLSLVCLTAAPAQVKESFWFRLLWDVCVCFIQTIRMRTSIDTTYFR